MTFFFGMAIEFWVWALVSLLFFVSSILLLRFRRGIAMQISLLISFLLYFFCCHLVVFGFVWCDLIVVFVYVLVWKILIKKYVKALAIEQLTRELKFYSSDFEIAFVESCEFMWLNLDYYEAKQHELELLGFRKVCDFEFLPQTRAFPEMRSFVRLLINAEYNIKASIIQIRAAESKTMSVRRGEICMIDFISEFSDGVFLRTQNMKSVTPILEVNEIVIQSFESDVLLEELLYAHEKKIKSISDIKNVGVIFYRAVEEMFDSSKREFQLLCQARQRKSGLTETANEQNISNFVNNDCEDAGVRAFLKEYTKQTKKITQEQKQTPEADV
jgi:hypothetical protein